MPEDAAAWCGRGGVMGVPVSSALPATDHMVRSERESNATGPGADAGSRITRFQDLSRRDRILRLGERSDLAGSDLALLEGSSPLAFEVADQMIENAVGVMGLPLGVGLNFRVNGRDYLVPMAIEEPSVVAAASYG